MIVKVEIPTGKYIDAEVSENATVKELKEKIVEELKIAEELNLPVKRLILVMEEDEETRRVVMDEEDEKMLKDLGVYDYYRMYLFFKHLDLLSEEERSQEEGGVDDDDVHMEEVYSEIESRRRKKEEDEKDQDQSQAMKGPEEDKDLANGEAKDDDDDDEVKGESRKGEEGDN